MYLLTFPCLNFCSCLKHCACFPCTPVDLRSSTTRLSFRTSVIRYLARLTGTLLYGGPRSGQNYDNVIASWQWRRSGESTRLPPIWSGFESWRRPHVWVEFVVSSLPCSERFFSGYFGFPLSLKTNNSKFQFDLEPSDTFQRVLKNP